MYLEAPHETIFCTVLLCPFSVTSKYFFQCPIQETLWLGSSLWVRDQGSNPHKITHEIKTLYYKKYRCSTFIDNCVWFQICNVWNWRSTAIQTALCDKMYIEINIEGTKYTCIRNMIIPRLYIQEVMSQWGPLYMLQKNAKMFFQLGVWLEQKCLQ